MHEELEVGNLSLDNIGRQLADVGQQVLCINLFIHSAGVIIYVHHASNVFRAENEIVAIDPLFYRRDDGLVIIEAVDVGLPNPEQPIKLTAISQWQILKEVFIVVFQIVSIEFTFVFGSAYLKDALDGLERRDAVAEIQMLVVSINPFPLSQHLFETHRLSIDKVVRGHPIN